MATVKAREDEDLEQRLRDLRLATWVTPEEQREVRRIVAGPWSQQGADRLDELGGENCAWAMQGKVPGETAECDALRSMVNIASKRHHQALRVYAAGRSLGEALARLGLREHEVWGGFSADRARLRRAARS